ncbi:RidA family protein [Citreimonas sp.]|uniref:RidA family protein n=1 Tax=Citreimonas sp. TaxID=3036715 RepID=UPI0035C7A8B2
MTPLTPATIPPPFARYAHGVHVAPGHALIATSGQLGLAMDGTIPEGAEAQAALCLANIDAILAEAGAARDHVIRLNAFVTGREHMAGYMVARDAWLAQVTSLPASTLMIVSGFTRPEFVVEIEALAAVPAEAR